MRVGLGFDSHSWEDELNRPLVLGGVTFEGVLGLVGHSDADVVSHAVADALLGAAGLGDIGAHFPDTDPEWKDADSIELLRKVAGMVDASGWRVANVDCTVALLKPKVAPHREEMQRNLAEAVGAPVSVKASRGEGLRLDGVACWAVALLEEK